MTPMHVAALYRHPVKGFPPQACESLEILPGGAVAGDRVLAFRFADAAAPDDAWGPKFECIALVNTPSLARVSIDFDVRSQQLSLAVGGTLLAKGSLEKDRARLAAALEAFVLEQQENPLRGQPSRVPLKLVGDGRTPRYPDRATDCITLHGRESLAALAPQAGGPVDERRFRSNVVVEGLPAWEEQRWEGRRIRIGAVECRFERPKGRCLATHANPRNGERDLAVMQLLPRVFPADKPIFAVALVPLGPGTLRLGDPVDVL